MRPIERKPTIGDRVCNTLLRMAPWEHHSSFGENGISLQGARMVKAKVTGIRRGSPTLHLYIGDEGFTIFRDFAPKLDGWIHTGMGEVRMDGVDLVQSRVLILTRRFLWAKRTVLPLEKFAKLLREGKREFECECETYNGQRAALRGFLWKGKRRTGAECWIEVLREKQSYGWNKVTLTRDGVDRAFDTELPQAKEHADAISPTA